jgi:hypothetical protein
MKRTASQAELREEALQRAQHAGSQALEPVVTELLEKLEAAKRLRVDLELKLKRVEEFQASVEQELQKDWPLPLATLLHKTHGFVILRNAVEISDAVCNELRDFGRRHGIPVANERTGPNSFGPGPEGHQRLQAFLTDKISEEARTVLQAVDKAIRESQLITDQHQLGSWVTLLSEAGVKSQFAHSDFTDDALTERNPEKAPELLPSLGKRLQSFQSLHDSLSFPPLHKLLLVSNCNPHRLMRGLGPLESCRTMRVMSVARSNLAGEIL